MRLAACTPPRPEAVKLLTVFHSDVDGAIMSHQLFCQARDERDPRQNAATMYHASCFVCAVRRVGRILEAMVANRHVFPEPVGDAVQLEWRKKRAFFGSFVDSRNAVEHIDSEVTDETTWLFFHLHNDEFTVANGRTVAIGAESLAKVVAARDAIDQVINESISDPMLDMLKHLES